MAIIFLLGRLIFGGFFLNSAYSHLFKSSGMVGYARSKKVPAPRLAIMGSGVLILLGSLSIILGVYPKLGALAIVLFLVPVSIAMHAYWNETDPGARGMQKIQFWKNMALLGAALMTLMIVEPWAYSL